MHDSDKEALKDIVARAKKGDHEAFSYLYKAYITPLYRYIYFRTGNKVDAEDLVQDVFLKAYKSFLNYSYSGTSPLAYFYTIARNTVIDFHRKKKIPVADDEESSMRVVDDKETPDQEAMRNESAIALHKQIGLLSEDQRDVVTLRFIEGLSTEEISTMLGKTEVAVRQLQSRALRALRKNFNTNIL